MSPTSPVMMITKWAPREHQALYVVLNVFFERGDLRHDKSADPVLSRSQHRSG